jgi:crotonobetainyl-CoA:carnitine CoA-transferase CaiB-like acyl-CoA transferase
VPYQVFATKNAQIVVAVGNDVQWQRFCKAIGRDDLAADQCFAKVKGRVTGRDELIPELCRTMLTQSTEFWIERLEAEDVPCGPINDYAQVFADPQVLHRKLRVDIPASGGASVSTAASPLRLTATPPRYDLAPPALGEHTDSVLTSLLGKTAEEIGAVRRDGII